MTSRPTTFEPTSKSRQSHPPRSAARSRRLVWEDDLRIPAAAFGLHWLLVTLFAALGTRYAYHLPVVKAVGWQLPERRGWQHLLVQPLRNWDGFWYSLIAEH